MRYKSPAAFRKGVKKPRLSPAANGPTSRPDPVKLELTAQGHGVLRGFTVEVAPVLAFHKGGDPLVAEAFHFGWQDRDFASMFALEDRCYLLRRNGATEGVLIANPLQRDLHMIYLQPALRRKGVASAFFDVVRAIAPGPWRGSSMSEAGADFLARHSVEDHSLHAEMRNLARRAKLTPEELMREDIASLKACLQQIVEKTGPNAVVSIELPNGIDFGHPVMDLSINGKSGLIKRNLAAVLLTANVPDFKEPHSAATFAAFIGAAKVLEEGTSTPDTVRSCEVAAPHQPEL